MVTSNSSNVPFSFLKDFLVSTLLNKLILSMFNCYAI